MKKRYAPLFLTCMLSLTALAPWTVQAQTTPATQTNEQSPDTAPATQKHAAQETPRETAAVNVEPPGEALLTQAPQADTAPLEADGLIARALDKFGEWITRLGGQLHLFKHSAADLTQWLKASFSDEGWRQLLLESAGGLLAVFVLGVIAQSLVGRGLRYPRQALAEHAGDAAVRIHRAAARMRAEESVVAATQQSTADETQAQAALAPEQENVVLVQTVRDGVERVESLVVQDAEDATPTTTSTSPLPSPEGVSAQPEPHPPVAPAQASSLSHRDMARRTLRLFPFAFATLLLDLLALAAFFCAAALAIHLLPALDPRASLVVRGFVKAYVTTYVCMAVIRVLIAPYGHGVRLLRITPPSARTLYTWLRHFIVFATFGIALASAAGQLGAGEMGRQAIVKLISLCIHLAGVMIIFRFRNPIGASIAAGAEATGSLASLRNWVAKIWVIPAALLIMGLWFIWALGIEDGFPRLMTLIVVTAAIIVAGRLLNVFVQGLVAKALYIGDSDTASNNSGSVSLRGSMGQRYYPLIRRLISFVVTVLTVVALLQSQGINAIGWFAPGTIGASMASAALTILTALVIAIIAWYAIDNAVQQRITRWTGNGELTRAARLKTLLPMMRTILLIILTLVVGLTALNQIGINTTPLLAGASIVGVALGFGSQKLVQDFITGIFLLMENAMQVGDGVTVAGVTGTVENLSIRTVRLRAGDGSLHIIPFSSVSTVNNTNRGIGNAAVRVSIGYEMDVNLATRELKKIGAELRADPTFGPLILADMEVWGVDAIDGSMFTLAGQIRCLSNGRWGVQRETNRRILERFRELDIRIADPRERLIVPEVEK
ncbi:mechanosensitive ion channel family protein [Pseudomonas capeferrum]|uniref:mechanosensitive ion channel family protein n=1 Tax=Pseudomonas capeferrum TaxID=1495066 RepID=UPI0015E2A7C6|nr:mechanosensitive ion channel family protein [Pseudomonas capeferrum]MBA1204407.1 mechanosensitive ion channel family protein [Pseudomonas capeferrum]